MAEYSNPAGRLHAVLSDARRRSAKEPARVVWAQVFGVEPTDSGSILLGLADVIRQVDEAKKAVASIPEVDAELYSSAFPVLERAFVSLNLEASFDQFSSRIDPPTMVALEFAAEVLSRHSPEQPIPKENLDDLLEQVEQLLKAVVESDVEDEFKVTLVEYLERIRQAILRYRLLGARGLREAMDQTIGFLARTDGEATGEPRRNVLQGVMGVLKNLNTILSLATRLKSLAPEELETLLQLPPG